MNGITILNTIHNSCDATKIVCGSLVAFLGFIVSLLTVCVLIKEHDCLDSLGEWIFTILAIIAFLAMTFSGIYYGIGGGLRSDETMYEVTIDNTVSMTEFTSKYKIVEQRDSIYVIKEIKK